RRAAPAAPPAEARRLIRRGERAPRTRSPPPARRRGPLRPSLRAPCATPPCSVFPSSRPPQPVDGAALYGKQVSSGSTDWRSSFGDRLLEGELEMIHIKRFAQPAVGTDRLRHLIHMRRRGREHHR